MFWTLSLYSMNMNGFALDNGIDVVGGGDDLLDHGTELGRLALERREHSVGGDQSRSAPTSSTGWPSRYGVFIQVIISSSASDDTCNDVFLALVLQPLGDAVRHRRRVGNDDAESQGAPGTPSRPRRPPCVRSKNACSRTTTSKSVPSSALSRPSSMHLREALTDDALHDADLAGRGVRLEVLADQATTLDRVDLGHTDEELVSVARPGPDAVAGGNALGPSPARRGRTGGLRGVGLDHQPDHTLGEEGLCSGQFLGGVVVHLDDLEGVAWCLRAPCRHPS